MFGSQWLVVQYRALAQSEGNGCRQAADVCVHRARRAPATRLNLTETLVRLCDSSSVTLINSKNIYSGIFIFIITPPFVISDIDLVPRSSASHHRPSACASSETMQGSVPSWLEVATSSYTCMVRNTFQWNIVTVPRPWTAAFFLSQESAFHL